jgi:hypothetical protein
VGHSRICAEIHITEVFRVSPADLPAGFSTESGAY